MTNPVHRQKKFVKYAGNEKPSSCYITDASGWLGSGVKDKNGKEIYEGDIVKAENDDVGFYKSDVWFEAGRFHFGIFSLTDFKPGELEIVGHIAEETS